MDNLTGCTLFFLSCTNGAACGFCLILLHFNHKPSPKFAVNLIRMLTGHYKHVLFKLKMFAAASSQPYKDNLGVIEGQIVCRIEMTVDPLTKVTYGAYSYTRLSKHHTLVHTALK